MKNIIFHFLILACLAVFVAGQDCWWTGCQLDSWAVKGCAQYGRDEKGRRGCNGGNEYQCCARTGDGGGGGGDVNSITWQQFRDAVTRNGFEAPTQGQYNSFRRTASSRGQITTKQEAAMALAHFIHETGGLKYKRERRCVEGGGCPGEYVQSDCDRPGQRYYGRGYIQLSWCVWNYRPCSRDLFGDDRLVNDPDMVARDEQLSWDVSYWFWSKNVHSKAISGRFGETTRAINGDLECNRSENHYLARTRFRIYGVVRSAFGLSGNGDERGCYN